MSAAGFEGSEDILDMDHACDEVGGGRPCPELKFETIQVYKHMVGCLRDYMPRHEDIVEPLPRHRGTSQERPSSAAATQSQNPSLDDRFESLRVFISDQLPPRLPKISAEDLLEKDIAKWVENLKTTWKY